MSKENYYSLVAVIGVEKADELCSRLGGAIVYIPKKHDYNNMIYLALGGVAAEKIIGAFGGSHLMIPSMSTIKRENRNNEIVNDIKGGMKRHDIAIKYQLTTRQIRNIETGAVI